MGLYSFNPVEQERIDSLILRPFPPFSELAPYSHEDEPGWDKWKDDEDCWACPHMKPYEVDPEYGPLYGCELKQYRGPRCRFKFYRHLLFRSFEPFTEEK